MKLGSLQPPFLVLAKDMLAGAQTRLGSAGYGSSKLPACLGQLNCCNRTPQTGGLNNSIYFSQSGTEKSKIKVLANSVSDKNCVLGHK